MDAEMRASLEARARIFKALAHPTRLLIVQMLARKEACVKDLTTPAGSDISTISKHLSILKQAGIIGDEKRGSRIFYHLEMPCVLDFFSCAERVIRKRASEIQAVCRVFTRKPSGAQGKEGR